MSLPFTAPFRLAKKAPRSAICLLPTAVVAATVAVAAQGPQAPEAAVARATAAPAAVRAAAPAVAAAPAPAPAPAAAARRAPVVSRSADRVDRRARSPRSPRSAQRAHRPHVPARHAKPAPQRPRGPLAPSNAALTVASAIRSTVNVPGHCLQWSREQARIPSKYADAATAWEHARGRRAGDANPPRGAVVYWTGGSHGYGHIAISLGHHRVRSSDAGGEGEVATVSIEHLSDEWHLRYAGWANSINGYTIPGVPAG
jgi:hypothetical protein